MTPVSPKKRTAPKGKVLARKKKKEAPAISAEETVIIQFVSEGLWCGVVRGDFRCWHGVRAKPAPEYRSGRAAVSFERVTPV